MTKLGLTAVLASVLAFQSCASVENVIIAEPDVAFSLPIGKTASVSGSPTRITFRQVVDDSRCPRNVVCVWEGDARIVVTVAREGSPTESAFLTLSSPGNEAQVGGLFVRFVSLAPYPETPQTNTPRAYIAEFVIRGLSSTLQAERGTAVSRLSPAEFLARSETV